MTDARPPDPENDPSEEPSEAAAREEPEAAAHEEPGTGGVPEEEEPELIGTLFVVMVLIIMTAGMWSAVYFMLLGR